MKGLRNFDDFCKYYDKFFNEDFRRKSNFKKKAFVVEFKKIIKHELKLQHYSIRFIHTRIFGDSFVIRSVVTMNNDNRYGDIVCFVEFPSDIPHQKSFDRAHAMVASQKVGETEIPMKQIVDFILKTAKIDIESVSN